MYIMVSPMRRVAVTPIQIAKFTVVRSDMFDLKSKDVERNIYSWPYFAFA